jgi:hypothetical protein
MLNRSAATLVADAHISACFDIGLWQSLRHEGFQDVLCWVNYVERPELGVRRFRSHLKQFCEGTFQIAIPAARN